MRTLLLSAAAAAFCLAGCNTYKPVESAAENGLRKDLKAVCEVINFKGIKTENKEVPEGKAAILHFESDVKWLTLEEALSQSGAARDAQEYLGKLEYFSSRFGETQRAGGRMSIKGAILMAKTDTGWIYKGLTKQ